MTKEDERNAMRQVMKEAIRDWLDSKFSQFGKWSLGAIAALVLAALLYFILTMSGWHRW
mgnify:CR=1 FL=1